MLFIHKDLPNHGKIEIVNNVLFLLSFLFGRFIFQIRLSYVLIQTLILFKYATVYGVYEKFVFWFTQFMQFSILLMNCYWLSLIVKGFIRKFSKAKKSGTPKKID